MSYGSTINVKLGATSVGTTFPDVIINTVEGTATNRIAGFAQIVHNPSELKTVVDALAQQEIPSHFADAIMLRRQELNEINNTWDFPLAASVPNTCPLPWTIIEASEKAALNNFKVEYNIMKTLDFNGRNILRIELPTVSLYKTNLANALSVTTAKEQAQVMYLGAWHRDLIPRIVKQIAIYPRSASHELFTYSGYACFIFNLIFGNERKEMNDLMSGEDKFELCYDPYRVEASALGNNSFKGVDVYSAYSTASVSSLGNFAASSARAMSATNANGPDTLIDYYQRNEMMDLQEFNDIYRKNVYYEAPIAQNYNARHSIHSRRVIHAAKSINVPLDILPFSHDLSSALSTASLAGECGYLRVELYDDWLSRAFYCTKISNIAPAHPLVNHLHYEVGDTYRYTNMAGGESVGVIEKDGENQLIGWVHVDSLGRFGDSEFKRDGGMSANGTADNSNVFNTTNAYSTANNMVGQGAGNAENVIQTKLKMGDVDAGVFGAPGTGSNVTVRSGNARMMTGTVGEGVGAVNGYMNVAGNGLVGSGVGAPLSFYGKNMSGSNPVYHSTLQRDPAVNWAYAQPNISNAATASTADLITSILAENSVYNTPIICPLIAIDADYDALVRSQIGVRLFQIGFQTLQSISELLTKLPNIYICTEWAERDFPITPLQNFDISINNDLYHIADVFWFIPKDNYGIESMRVYPPHMINHEMPLINTMRMQTQLDQGRTVFDWDMLNIINPSYMGLNPLLENIGILSFSPEIHANSFPLAYYDPNIAGEIRCTFEMGSNIAQNLVGADRYSVNLKRGTLKVLTIGVNGVVSVNLNLFRLVF